MAINNHTQLFSIPGSKITNISIQFSNHPVFLDTGWMLVFKLAILESRWYAMTFKSSKSNIEVKFYSFCFLKIVIIFLSTYSVIWSVYGNPSLFLPATPFQLSNAVLQSILPSKSNLLRSTSFHSFFVLRLLKIIWMLVSPMSSCFLVCVE